APITEIAGIYAPGGDYSHARDRAQYGDLFADQRPVSERAAVQGTLSDGPGVLAFQGADGGFSAVGAAVLSFPGWATGFRWVRGRKCVGHDSDWTRRSVSGAAF